jgi:hypothetical protein
MMIAILGPAIFTDSCCSVLGAGAGAEDWEGFAGWSSKLLCAFLEGKQGRQLMYLGDCLQNHDTLNRFRERGFEP